MREIEITCLCTALRLPDLGITLVKGQVAHVPLDKGRLSKDLERARRVGGVSIRETQRAQTNREGVPEAPPPRASSSRPVQATARPVPAPVARVQAPAHVPQPAPLDTQMITQAVRAAVQAELRQMFAGAGMSAPSGGRAPVMQDDTPTFIPEGMVGRVKGSVSIEAEETEASGVDAASTALRGRKKSARKEPK